MNKKLVKAISTLLMIVMLCSISMAVFAAEDKLQPSAIQGSTSVKGSDSMQTVGNTIVGILRTFGVILSVVVLIILGIKYMMGSAEEKADYKKSMLPYIVGAALIFAASIFAQVIYEFFSGINLK